MSVVRFPKEFRESPPPEPDQFELWPDLPAPPMRDTRQSLLAEIEAQFVLIGEPLTLSGSRLRCSMRPSHEPHDGKSPGSAQGAAGTISTILRPSRSRRCYVSSSCRDDCGSQRRARCHRQRTARPRPRGACQRPDRLRRSHPLRRRDFLMERKAPDGSQAIITNPPFKLAGEFVEHALNLMSARRHAAAARIPGVWNAVARSSKTVASRGSTCFGIGSPQCIATAGRGRRRAVRCAFAWFCWDRAHVGAPTIHRISLGGGAMSARHRRCSR